MQRERRSPPPTPRWREAVKSAFGRLVRSSPWERGLGVRGAGAAPCREPQGGNVLLEILCASRVLFHGTAKLDKD